MTLPLAGKVAVITGSSRAIGAAVAKQLAADGAHVIVNYATNAAAAQSVADGINTTAASGSGSGRAVSVQADAGTVAGCVRLIDAAFEHFGALDVLVLCAAVAKLYPLQDLSEDVFDLHFQFNVKAPLFAVKAAIPRMKAGGRIIFFSSQLTRNSLITPEVLMYASTKGAVEQMTRVLAKDLGARGITVNTIAPGPVDTDLFRAGKSDELIARIASLHPAGRIAQPDDIAPLVAFLARDEARWVNGQVLMANGGYTV